MTSEGFFSDLLKVFDAIFCCRDGGCWECVGNGSGFIAHHEEERGGISGVVFSMVMDELCHREVLDPF
jgi:hypothetical protein